MRRIAVCVSGWSLLLATASACASPKPAAPAPAPQPVAAPPRVVHDTVQVRDPDTDRRVSHLELRLMEKEALVDQLQTRLDDARDEVVRTMSKLQTLASRAEAASAIAEADVALRSLRTTAGSQSLPEIGQAQSLVQESNTEFGKQNFGGALYLATQAKAIAVAGQAHTAVAGGSASGTTARPGETQLAIPIRIKASSRGNVREGPGTTFAVTFPVAAGDELTAYSYTDDWVRVRDDTGRTGWIFRALVTRP